MLRGETDTFPTNDSPGHFTTRSGRQWPHESFRLLTYNCIDIPFKFSGESVLFLPQTNMHMHISKGKCMCCCVTIVRIEITLRFCTINVFQCSTLNIKGKKLRNIALILISNPSVSSSPPPALPPPPPPPSRSPSPSPSPLPMDLSA